MTTENTNSTQPKESIPLSVIFGTLDPEYSEKVVGRALEFRDEASDSVQSRLNSAIRDSVKIDGFRDASKAKPDQLRRPVLSQIVLEDDGRLSGEVLKAWAESHEKLRDLVAEHLISQSVPAEGPDFQARRFNSVWPESEWEGERDVITAGHDDLDETDVALMLCYVSGRFPRPDDADKAEIESPTLLKWLHELRALPPDSLEFAEARLFAESVIKIADDKHEERIIVVRQALDTAIAEIRNEFESDLRYLDLDIDSWSSEEVEEPDVIPDLLEVAETLKLELVEYSPIRPQAPSRVSESARAEAREVFETRIFDVAGRWNRLIENPTGPDDDSTSDGRSQQNDSDEPSDTTELSGGDGLPTQELDDSRDGETQTGEQPSQDLRPEAHISETRVVAPSQDYDSLKSENTRLGQASAELQSDNTLLGKQVSGLKAELSRTKEMEKSWRRAYIESASQAPTEKGEPAQLNSVNDALAHAERTFPDQLVFALNSKSAKNSPFQKPDEVFDALAWLATEYHELRMNPGASPGFNRRIKESCPGWFYKAGQTDVTKEQFYEWYTTSTDGKRYELDTHIGKGTSFNPQNTIRIAFAWDDERHEVVVGFLGLHQRNRRS